MGLVTIKESHYEADLLVLKSRLESEGIKCYMKNEYSAQILTHMPTFMVELQVAEQDLEKVQKIISDSGINS